MSTLVFVICFQHLNEEIMLLISLERYLNEFDKKYGGRMFQTFCLVQFQDMFSIVLKF